MLHKGDIRGAAALIAPGRRAIGALMGTLSKSGINAEVRDRMEHLVEPQTNGGIELHRTMADGWAFRRMFLSEPARREAPPGWLHEYDHHRLHTAIGNQPPSPA